MILFVKTEKKSSDTKTEKSQKNNDKELTICEKVLISTGDQSLETFFFIFYFSFVTNITLTIRILNSLKKFKKGFRHIF